MPNTVNIIRLIAVIYSHNKPIYYIFLKPKMESYFGLK
jgi:hypothetical protein